MYIKFVKDHTSGIKAGAVAEFNSNTAARLIADKIAVESNLDERIAYVAKAKQEKTEADAERLKKAKQDLKDKQAKAEADAEAKRKASETEADKIKALETENAELKATIEKLKADQAKPAKK